MNNNLEIKTTLGTIVLHLRGDVAPKTVAHVKQLVQSGLLNKTTFYRSDFVIQFGLHGTAKKITFPDLDVNESKNDGALQNVKG
jgi:cyclophilin family peptidyl-prolyl cis-trans isomerase